MALYPAAMIVSIITALFSSVHSPFEFLLDGGPPLTFLQGLGEEDGADRLMHVGVGVEGMAGLTSISGDQSGGEDQVGSKDSTEVG
jgi:hypothetical protein